MKNIGKMNQKSRIRTIDPYLDMVEQGESFHVVREVTNESDARLLKIGFKNLDDGEQVLPRALGSVTRRNCNGYDLIFRDRPKEPYTISFMAPGWHDTYHPVSITRWRYPRKHIDGYEIELTLIHKDGKRFIASPELVRKEEYRDIIKHTLNLFLELFGGFNLMNKDMESIFREMTITNVNWTLLPIGEYPFERLEREGYLPTGKKNEKVYRHTDNVIRKFNPSQCVIGNGGFRGYVAFLFPDRNLTILEHFENGNATYVFDKNWEELSRMTKAQIVNQNLELARIIHKNNWEYSIRELFACHPSE